MHQLNLLRSQSMFSFLKFSQTLTTIQLTASKTQKINILSTYIKTLLPKDKQLTKQLFDFVHMKTSTGISDKLLINRCTKYFGVELTDQSTMKNKQTVKILQRFIAENKVSENLQVEQINEILAKVKQINGKNAVELKMTQVIGTLNRLSFIQARFFLRILTKDMRVGMKSKLVQKAYEEAMSTQNDSKSSISLKTFNAMLARPLRDVEQFQKFCQKKKGKIIADVKYDGQRTLITYEKGKSVVLLSRNGKPQNEKYFKIAQQLQLIFDRDKQLINVTIDAEILAVDKKTEQPLPFQVLLTRRRKVDSTLAPNEDENTIQVIYAFDILQYNGSQLYNIPLIQRKQMILENSLIRRGGYMIFDYPQEKDNLMEYFKQIVRRKYEGLILKGVDDNYSTNGSRVHWGKLKKGFRLRKEDKGSMDLDLIVMGADYGRGKKTKYFSSFLMGVKYGIKIVPISRVGTGFSDEQLEQLTYGFKKVITDKMDRRYEVPKDIKMDVWFKPQQVIQIDCQQLTRSPMYEFGFRQNYGGISLRFPVFKKLRSDKNIDQATEGKTILEEMNKQQQRIISKALKKQMQAEQIDQIRKMSENSQVLQQQA